MREQDKANLLLDMQEHPENYTDEQLTSMLADDKELAEMLEAAAKTKQAMTKAAVDNEELPMDELWEQFAAEHADEFDDEADEFVRLSNGDYIVRGDMTLSDLEDVLDIELDNDEYDTIAGLVISQLDRVPEETEHPVVNYKNLRIKVLKVEENAIAKVLIHINPVTKPEEDGSEENSGSDE